jgi:hypothetical protein
MRRASLHVPARIARLEDLVETLKAKFPQRCVKEGEDLIQAHRYAAKAELVAWIVSQCTPDED